MPHNVTNERVVVSFLKGERNETTNMRSTGRELYSYEKLIATRHATEKWVFIQDYTASGVFISQTTSKHVMLVKRHAKAMGFSITIYNPKLRMGILDHALNPGRWANDKQGDK